MTVVSFRFLYRGKVNGDPREDAVTGGGELTDFTELTVNESQTGLGLGLPDADFTDFTDLTELS